MCVSKQYTLCKNREIPRTAKSSRYLPFEHNLQNYLRAVAARLFRLVCILYYCMVEKKRIEIID
jgi:hypothetical protein